MKNHVRLMPEMYQTVVQAEQKSLFFLWSMRFPRKVAVCPRCQRDIRGLSRASLLNFRMKNLRRYWCPDCHYRFSDFSGTFLSSNKLPWSKVIVAVYFFILGKTARQCAKLLEINYKSAHTLFRKIRLAIPEKYKSKTDAINPNWRYSRYLKGKLGAHRHIAPDNIPLYLKEQEYKYYKQGGVLEELLRYLLTTHINNEENSEPR
ncbi:MAG: hypothetical protein AB1599_06760 [Planctomycetota bacterium]